MWKHADTAVPLEMDPMESGWKREEGRFVMNWYSGPQLPTDFAKDMERIVSESDEDSSSDESDHYTSDESLYESD